MDDSKLKEIATKIDGGTEISIDDFNVLLQHNAKELEKQLQDEQDSDN